MGRELTVVSSLTILTACSVSCFSVDLQSVEGMKVLCFELMEAAAGRASAYMLANLAASANELVIELTNRVHQVTAHTIHRRRCTG